MSDPIVIVGFARTPIGCFQGSLSSLTAPELGAIAIKASLEKFSLEPSLIDAVWMGCVLTAGLGQAPARQAALLAKLSNTVSATTLNKMCGSGLQAIMVAHDLIAAGSYHCIVAGGFESMSNTPYLLDKARKGYRMGHQTIADHMLLDGLEDAYDKGKHMGLFAEATAAQYGFSRLPQDEFALTSLTRAKKATAEGSFLEEIAAVEIVDPKIPRTIRQDEGPLTANPEKIPQLRPVFKDNGTITAANASGLSDGAAALVLMRESQATAQGLTPLARIVGQASHSQEPALFTTAPVAAIQKLLAKINWPTDSVDLYEINEAFAVVTLVAMQQLKLSAEKVNIHGGACALGHPIGASGARIVCTLLAALKRHDKQRGVASLCIGGGEAVAMAIERI